MRGEIHVVVLVAASKDKSNRGGRIDDPLSIPMLMPVLIDIDYIRMWMHRCTLSTSQRVDFQSVIIGYVAKTLNIVSVSIYFWA